MHCRSSSCIDCINWVRSNFLETWSGYYSQCKNDDLFEAKPEPGVSIITGIGGKGMTTTAGLAESRIRSMYSLASS